MKTPSQPNWLEAVSSLILLAIIVIVAIVVATIMASAIVVIGTIALALLLLIAFFELIDLDVTKLLAIGIILGALLYLFFR